MGWGCWVEIVVLCLIAIIALAVSMLIPMRVGEDEERDGFDLASHGERAWEFD